MSSIQFNFSTLGELRPALNCLKCKDTPSATFGNDQIRPLHRLAAKFGRSRLSTFGLGSAEVLTQGCCRDIVVVLLESTNGASEISLQEILEASDTLSGLMPHCVMYIEGCVPRITHASSIFALFRIRSGGRRMMRERDGSGMR